MRYGLAETLGGGPIAVELYDAAVNTHPYAYALMRAAGDWRRSGMGDVVPQDLAVRLVDDYLPADGVDYTDETPVQSVEWVTRLETGRNAFRLLTSVGDGWRLFDYLTDHIANTCGPINDAMWKAIVACNAPARILASVGYNAATEANRTDIAEQLFRRAADLGHAGAMINLGVLLCERGEVGEAEELYRRAVDLGHGRGMYNLGVLMYERGEVEEAEELYRRTVDLGHAGGTYNLGVLRHRRGEVEEAEQLFRRAVDLGHAGAMYALGVLRHRRGEVEEAEHLYRRAVDLGHARAMVELGLLLYQRGEVEEAEHLYRRAVDIRDADAISNLAELASKRRDVEQAE
jgi:TPR repeat protein